MGNGYDHHHRHFHRKSIFLPMLCRLSIKDIYHRNKTPISGADEPSSPKVSCMGQVKRNTHRYSKLKRLFSGKTLLPPTTGGGTRSSSFRFGGGGSEVRVKDQRKVRLKNECAKVVNIGEIDPPLPVVKRASPGGDEANLWRRRFNGAAALKGLQIEPITRNICSQPPTV